MVEEKVYCRYEEEHGQRQGDLGKSRVNMTPELGHVRTGRRGEVRKKAR